MGKVKIKEEKEEMLLELLEKELGFYRVILELSRVEHQKFCNKRPMNEILPIMKKRRIIFKCVEEIEEQVHPLKKKWRENRKTTSFINEEIQENINTLENLIKEILSLNEESGHMLEQHMYHLTKQHQAIISRNKKK